MNNNLPQPKNQELPPETDDRKRERIVKALSISIAALKFAQAMHKQFGTKNELVAGILSNHRKALKQLNAGEPLDEIIKNLIERSNATIEKFTVKPNFKPGGVFENEWEPYFENK